MYVIISSAYPKDGTDTKDIRYSVPTIIWYRVNIKWRIAMHLKKIKKPLELKYKKYHTNEILFIFLKSRNHILKSHNHMLI